MPVLNCPCPTNAPCSTPWDREQWPNNTDIPATTVVHFDQRQSCDCCGTTVAECDLEPTRVADESTIGSRFGWTCPPCAELVVWDEPCTHR